MLGHAAEMKSIAGRLIKPQSPNPRLQRTRMRAPLSRQPFGVRKAQHFSMKKLLSVLVMLGLTMVGSAGADISYSRAIIYLEGWNVLTRAALSPEHVRKVAPTVLTVTEPKRIAALVGWLRLSELKSRRPDPVDARLVVDFFGPDGKRVSYHASRFELVSEDREHGRPIDEEFRHRFERPEGW